MITNDMARDRHMVTQNKPTLSSDNRYIYTYTLHGAIAGEMNITQSTMDNIHLPFVVV